MRTIAPVLLAALIVLPVSLHAQGREPGPPFVFHTDDFWLNLHHFLYVLGRHEAGTPDRTRRAMAGAPDDAAKGLAGLVPGEQQAWRDVVSEYARGPSKQDTVFDAALVKVGIALAAAGPAPSLSGSAIDPAIAGALEKAAPVYRKAWWSAHQRANEEWVRSTRTLADRHGAAVLRFVTRAYAMPWPAAGFPIRVSAYSNWAGAYSTTGNLLVMSSLDQGNQGIMGLEISFHEAMHQWDDGIETTLTAEARKQGATVPDLLSHALIFFTAGEAIRAIAPEHVPYAEVNGLWRQRGLGALKPALDEVWKPYLSGRGTRDEALAELVKRVQRSGQNRSPARSSVRSSRAEPSRFARSEAVHASKPRRARVGRN